MDEESSRRKGSECGAVPTTRDMQGIVEAIAEAQDVTVQEAATLILIDGISAWYAYRSAALGGNDDPTMAAALRRAHSVVKQLPRDVSQIAT